MTACRCPLCGRPAPRRFVARGFDVHRCGLCDMEFVWPTPTQDVIEKVYAEGYFEGSGAGYEDYFRRERAQVMTKSGVRLDALGSLGARGGRLLDIGCAAGFFLEAARDRGFDVYGVEHARDARDRAHPSLAGRIFPTLNDARAHAPFAAVTLFDTLEHLADPFETLRALAPLLAPEAVVAVVLPVLGSVNTRLAPATWDQYKPPEHLWFWSRAAMRETLARTLGAPVALEASAWVRHGRFIDPEQRSPHPATRALASLDRALGRCLGAIAPTLVTDSVAFYVKVA